MKKTALILLTTAMLLSLCVPYAAGATEDYDFLWAYHDGIAQFEKDGKIGLMNEAGEIILPAEYDEINPCFQNGYTWVIKGGLYGLIDDEGNVVIEPQYAYMEDVSSGLIVAQDVSTLLFGYLDVSGNWVIEPQYVKAESFSGNIAIVFPDGDKLAPDYKYIKTAAGYSPVAYHAVVLNAEGDVVTDLGYVSDLSSCVLAYGYNYYREIHFADYPSFAKGDLFIYKHSVYTGKYSKGDNSGIGFLNEEGEIVDCSTLEYNISHIKYYGFSDGLAMISEKIETEEGKTRNIYGYLNRNGDVIIEPQFMYGTRFYNGKAYVTDIYASLTIDNKDCYFIDTQGNACGKDGILAKDYDIDYSYKRIELSETDILKKKDYCWYAMYPASETVYIYQKVIGTENGMNTGVDRGYLTYAYVNNDTHEILYENSFARQETDYGCGLYIVCDSKDNVGFINENGELVSGLKEKGK